jgi:hypothetical protein
MHLKWRYCFTSFPNTNDILVSSEAFPMGLPFSRPFGSRMARSIPCNLFPFWLKNQKIKKKKKMYSCLIMYLEWEERFPEVTQRRLPRLLSDHFPLLLDCGVPREGNEYFKFENMWLKLDGFVDQVKSWWMSYEFFGLPSYVLVNKLKALKIWNDEVFGDVGKKKKELLEGIRELDLVEESRCLEEDERVRKLDILRELEKTLLFEEMSWRQKS